MPKAEMQRIVDRVVDKHVDAQLEAELSALRSDLRGVGGQLKLATDAKEKAEKRVAFLTDLLLDARAELIDLQKQQLEILKNGVKRYIDEVLST